MTERGTRGITVKLIQNVFRDFDFRADRVPEQIRKAERRVISQADAQQSIAGERDRLEIDTEAIASCARSRIAQHGSRRIRWVADKGFDPVIANLCQYAVAGADFKENTRVGVLTSEQSIGVS